VISVRRDQVSWLASAAFVAIAMAVPLTRDRVAAIVGLRNSYTYGSIILLLLAVAITRLWPAADSDLDLRSYRWPIAWIGGTALAFGVCIWMASALLPELFAGPLDIYRADMLPVIEAGVREFLAGRTPYTRYEHIPWRPTLPYGPSLWLPFVLPVLARSDVRLLTLAGYLTVTCACCFAIAYSAAARHWTPSFAVAGPTLLLAAHPDIHAFYPIAHSPAYWPVLFGFCLLLRAERWTAAAATLGLLVSARTPMVSIVPVFLIAAYHRQRLTRGVLFAVGATAVGPFVPFILQNARAVAYSMYGSYQDTVKGVVWLTGGIFQTYGSTALLLEHDLSGVVELTQLVCLLIVYAVAWRSLAARVSPFPWLALALLVFSLTALWPVIYLYFDVWVLLVSGLAVTAVPIQAVRRRSAACAAVAVIAVPLVAIATAAMTKPGPSYTIDVGTPAAAPLTGGGFGQDRVSMEDARSFVWVEGTTARIRLPRAAWTGATVRVELRPYEPFPGLRQRVTASVNEVGIGTTLLQPGWQEISFTARRRLWVFGFNVLNLYFSYALPGPDGRELSVAIDRITID
jgi:hypothetical protein